MKHEAQPRAEPVKHEDAKVSEAWGMYDELEEKVEPLVADYHLAWEPAAEQSRKLEMLLECKLLAEQFRAYVVEQRMPVLPERTEAILSRIKKALDKKLH